MNMKRVTIIFAVVTVLLLADGLWMQLTHYHPDDQNSFFGNGNIVLSDGQVLLISGGFLFAGHRGDVAGRCTARSEDARQVTSAVRRPVRIEGVRRMAGSNAG